MSRNELIEDLYKRGKKLFDRINKASVFEEPLKDSIIVANISQEKDKENNNIKSYDTLEKAELLDYSMKPNGNLDTGKLKESLSNNLNESSENGSPQGGYITSEGHIIRVSITKYKTLVLKFGKITFLNNGYMNNSLVMNNDILFLESRIPKFKANVFGGIIYDILKNYHQQGSDKEDTNNLVNINQTNSHKINLDETNIVDLAQNKILIFLHKVVTQEKKSKDISNAQKTQIIENKDTIIGYCSLEMSKIFLSDDFRFYGKINLIEKNVNKDDEKNQKKKNTKSNSKSKDKNKNKNLNKKEKENKENQYNEKGERIIGTIEVTAYLKPPRDALLKEENNKLASSLNKLINNNNINNNNNNNINNNINNNKINQSPMKEFIIGQPPIYNNNINNNIINEENNLNENDMKLNEKSENGEEKLMVDDGMEKIRTDINGDILILYLKINELKSSNDIYNPENSISNNLNINEQLNNLDKNKNIIFYNYTASNLPRHNFFLRHKIFPENKDATSEIIWNKFSPNFNYSIQMPFTLNQKTVELLDNGKFLVEVWTKGENNNSCLGFVSFDLKDVLDSLKVNENTITTLQLYKNTLPYIIYDDFYQLTQINEAQGLGTMFLKVCIGIGTPTQVHNFEKLIKKISINQKNQNQQNINNNQINGMSNNENINAENNNNDINNNQNEKNNMSLDPFKEDIKDNKDELNQNNQSNISKAAEINVEQIFEKNKKSLNLDNNNNNNNISKGSLKKSESFDDNLSNKKKIVNPFSVPQNYEQENEQNKNTIKETAKFTKLLNNDTNEFDSMKNNLNNFESINRYNNNQDTFKNNNNYNINDYNEKNEEKNEYNINEQNDINNNNKYNYLNENDLNKSNKNEEFIEEKIEIEKDNQDNENNNINNNNDIIDQKEQEQEQEKNIMLDMYENNNGEINEINNNKLKNDFDNFDSIKNNEEKNNKINIDINTKENINIDNNISSHVKKHIFTISIEKIYNCQILSKLPSAYLRYQFFTDQKPLRSELFSFSQFAVDSSVIDVDMKSMHSIILPKVEKIKDYLSDFLVEFLYDIPQKKNNSVIIGRVNIPSDEFAALIGEKDSVNKNMNEMSRVLFIYGTEKIQRNKCIIGKLKLNFKYTSIDVPMNNNNNLYLNGSLMNSLNNNSISPNFAGSIYLEKETIFNRKIPKNAVLKINIEKFSSTSLFEDYYRKQFSIYFIFSVFGEVAKMENQYGKRATSKKYNLLNCDFGETLSYKLEIDQDIIDYLKCRNGIVYLVYKISKNKNEKNNNVEDINDLSDKEDLNLPNFENAISKNKKIIGKGIFNLNEILTSADTNYKEVSISQIGNGSMSLGVLNISLNLENDNSGLYSSNEENINKKILSNNTSELYKQHNLSFNKCDPSLYLNGKFLFSINFTKFYYEINSEIGAILNNLNYFYFVFKLGNKIKKISPKFNQENNELFSLNINSNLILINYVEMIELNLNFNKKLPNDLYNLFNEGILEIKLYQADNANSLGSFYIDLHKLITSEFFSENVLYSGNNVINLINVNNNTYKNCKIEVNLAIFKLNEMQMNSDIVNKVNYLSNNLNNNQEITMSNLDYCEYYQNLFVKDFTDYIIQGLFNINTESNKDKDENNMNLADIENENIYTIEKIKKVLNFNNIDMFNFINNNLINLIDTKNEINLNNFKKIFNLITKLNFDVFDFYYTSCINPQNNTNFNFTSNTFDYYLNSHIINLDNEDMNIINFLKDKQNKVDIGISNNSLLNQNNNKTIKKLLTTNYNYGFNETNDYLDVVSLCLFIFDYYYNLNNEILFNVLKIRYSNNMINDMNNNNIYSKTQPLIYKKEPQYFNHTVYNMNSMNLNDINKNSDVNLLNKRQESKIMLISVLSGHNIIKPNSDFTSRPNCYFVLEFDDKNYTSDVVMNTSQPNFNEELEIKINAEEYLQKLNALNIYISVFSFIDENNSVLIGKCEINPAKMFPFLNENNECDDFFHIIGEKGQVMGQLYLKFKFEKNGINNNFKYNIHHSYEIDKNNLLNNKKNNNTISYPLNNVFEKNNSKDNFMKTGNESDLLHLRLQEAMNSIDDLTQILKNKVELEKKENIVENINNNLNEEEMIENYNGEEEYKEMTNYNEEEEIHEQELNGEEMEENYEEQVEHEEYINEDNINNNINIDNINIDNSNNIDNNNSNLIDNGNNQINNFNNNLNNDNILNDNNNIEYENKMALTDVNNLNNSQKFSANEEDNEKPSFYSEKDENNKKKMKYLKNYDKNLLNKIQKIMKNKK